jgi:hypothetical protein
VSFNPFNHFWLFVGAVWVHAITLAAGCVVTVVINLLEKYVFKKILGWKYDLAILLVFVFFACFQAWRDQYEIAVKVNQNPPIQITNQVTVPPAPAPIVNIPSQMAYLSSTDSVSLAMDTYKIGGQLAMNYGCKNLSTTVIAEQGLCQAGVRIAEAKPNPLKMPFVLPSVQNKIYKEFRGSLSAFHNPQRRTYAQGESSLASLWTPVIDADLDQSFREGTKTIMFLAKNTWKDGSGWHESELCQFLQFEPRLFAGPGRLVPNSQVLWHYCDKHSGLVK